MTSTKSNPPRPSAILAEDEPLLAAELQEVLTALWPELEIMGVAPDGIAALHLIEKFKPDFVFLDIEMPRMNGLQVARQIGDRAHIVFITAFDQHAVAAFEAGALDYVLKPASTERLAATVQRLKSRAGTAPVDLSQVLDQLNGAPKNGKKHLQWINAARGSTTRLITVDEICYFKADHKYTLVVTSDSESLIKKTIRELQEELDPELFWQVHRSTVVNVHCIESVVRDDRGGMQLKVKHRPEMLQVSEAYGHLFKQM
jgi:DNA-binding LytR/AlgR family response regulator